MGIRHMLSQPRAAATGTAQADDLPAPARVDVTRGHQTLAATWSAVLRALAYDVEYSDATCTTANLPSSG